MKFYYQYRTSDNVRHDGEICAPSREAAFALLKAKGIRPGLVEEAPGFFNKLFGKGKRWMAIGALAIVASVLAVMLCRDRQRASEMISAGVKVDDGTLDRRQLLGDALVIAKGVESDWGDVFSRKCDRFLAKYVQPGTPVRRLPPSELAVVVEELAATLSGDPLVVEEDDLEEVKQVKRIVAGIRKEMREYVQDGGTVSQYVDCLMQRQQYETSLRSRAKMELDRIRLTRPQSEYMEEWKRINLDLRKVGVALVPMDED